MSSAFDVPTLLLISTSIAALLGFFLLFAWLQERSMRALAWWGAAYLIGGCAMALWNEPLASSIINDIPIALLLVACGMVWNGIRVFYKRRVLPLAIFAGASIWIAVSRMEVIAGNLGGRLVLGAMIVAVYAFCSTVELRRDRRRSEYSRLRLVAVPLLHAAMFLLPLAFKIVSSTAGGDGLANEWFELFALETMIYAVGMAFIVLFMVKDHHVQIHKTAASTDPLTGLFNRRAFFEAAHELRARCARQGEPISVLMFDLDKFKSINDRFGHATGDDVIKRFAETVSASMRVTDIVGRFGGEEFAAIVPGGRDIAELIGERVRANFEIAGVQFRELRIDATCSIGASTAPAAMIDTASDLDRLIERADAALYRAKEEGRNRVRVDEQLPVHPVAVHIAAARAANLPVIKSPGIVPEPSQATAKV